MKGVRFNVINDDELCFAVTFGCFQVTLFCIELGLMSPTVEILNPQNIHERNLETPLQKLPHESHSKFHLYGKMIKLTTLVENSLFYKNILFLGASFI